MSVITVWRGDVYYANLPEEIAGSMQARRRPVLITQSNWLNRSSPTVLVTCLTSQIKNEEMECHYVLPMLKGLPLQTMVLGETRYSLDKSLLLDYCCHLDRELMRQVSRAIRAAERDDDDVKRKWKSKK